MYRGGYDGIYIIYRMFLETVERDAPRFFSLSQRDCFRVFVVANVHRIRIAVGMVKVFFRIVQ